MAPRTSPTTRVAAIVTALLALLAMVYTWILMSLLISSLHWSPGIQVRLQGEALPATSDGYLPPGLEVATASPDITIPLIAHDVDQTFLLWQQAAWIARYGLALLALAAVIVLAWRVLRGHGLGRLTAWLLGGLGLLAVAVAVFSPWALAHADQLFIDAIGATQFHYPAPDAVLGTMAPFSLQDCDWWLIVVGVVALVTAPLLARAHRAEADTEGLI